MTEPLPRREPGAHLPGSRESAGEPLWPSDDDDEIEVAGEPPTSLPNVAPPDMRDLERVLAGLRNWYPYHVERHEPRPAEPSPPESKEEDK